MLRLRIAANGADFSTLSRRAAVRTAAGFAEYRARPAPECADSSRSHLSRTKMGRAERFGDLLAKKPGDPIARPTTNVRCSATWC